MSVSAFYNLEFTPSQEDFAKNRRDMTFAMSRHYGSIVSQIARNA